MPFGNGRFNPNSDIVYCLFSFQHPCRLSYISYVLHQGYALICNWCRTPARNIHSIRQIGLFGPSLFLGTMASADSSHFDFLGVALCEVSWDKSMLFPRLPLWFTPWSYVCLLGFVASCQLTRPKRLGITFVFVGLRFRYHFFSRSVTGSRFVSRYLVRRQLRLLGLSP